MTVSDAQLAQRRAASIAQRCNWDEIARLTKAGRSIGEIADLTGCTRRTVSRVRNRLLLSKPPSLPYSEEEKRLALALLEDGCPYTEVARTLNRSPQRLGEKFPGYGMPTPEDALEYGRNLRAFERLVRRLGLDERPER